MVGLVLSADQLRSAPEEVKNWLRGLLQRELLLGGEAEIAPSQMLAECSPDEAALVLRQIHNDYLACQVFFELGREDPVETARRSVLHRTSVDEIMHHVPVGDVQHLVACLEEISNAFGLVRRDPEAKLLAIDERGGCYVHQTTRRSIKGLWEALVTARLQETPASFPTMLPAGPTMPLNAGVARQDAGPTETRSLSNSRSGGR
jgi:hypothetical protein